MNEMAIGFAAAFPILTMSLMLLLSFLTYATAGQQQVKADIHK